MLENQFDVDVIKFLISLIVASRDGVLESEITELLEQSKLVESMCGLSLPSQIINMKTDLPHLI